MCWQSTAEGAAGKLTGMDDACTSLIQSIAKLPRLSDLRLSLPYDSSKQRQHPAANLAAVGAFTRLTALSLSDSALTDFAVCALACALTGLRRLDLSGNSSISDTTLPVIAVQMPKLTALHLMGTGATLAGLGYMTRLVGLQELYVPQGIRAESVRELAWSGPVSIQDAPSA
jgi:hypothetical protein